MNPLDIIEKFYKKESDLYKILMEHSYSVTNKALELAKKHPELNIDLTFVSEAGMLHDIGIFMVNAPSIHCLGDYPYIAHGYLGCELMQKENCPKHALVCERHTGAGLELSEIIEQNLPIPHREMMPISTEEKLICFTDKFYSKSYPKEKSIDQIVKGMSKYGEKTVKRFLDWCDLFL